MITISLNSYFIGMDYRHAGHHCIVVNTGLSKLVAHFVTFQAFSKKKVDDRKEWLTNFMEDRRQRKLLGLPDVSGFKINSGECSNAGGIQEKIR